MCNIAKLQYDFNSILRLRTELQSKRDTLESKLGEIKAQYNDLVRNNPKKIYLYCLDSMYFQYKILRVELEQFQKTTALIFNRMYGDYYKLYNIIQSQCKDNNTNIKLSTENVVVYKDLDPFAEFSVEDLVQTHRIIIETLQKLLHLYESKQEEINTHNVNMRIGFSVTSFISTLAYENKILGEHIALYSEYLSFYHSSQRKYLDNTLGKITNFMREIEDDILTNHKSYEKETITIVDSIVEEPNEEGNNEELSQVIDEVKHKLEEVKQETEVLKQEIEEVKQETRELKHETDEVKEETKEVKQETVELKEETKQELEEVSKQEDGAFQTIERGKHGKLRKR